MRLRSMHAAALSVVALASLTAAAATATAAPATVHVRVEGLRTTLFDGELATDGHIIQATSDTASTRYCDGVNLGANPTPGPTATTATVDAMAAIGKTFDAKWYPGFDDYFIRQWGEERENEAEGFYWGILVNGVFTPVGGCQFQVRTGDEVLWANDAFSARRFLWLAGPAEAVVGQPLTVDVSATKAKEATADTNRLPYAGATVGAADRLGQPASGIATSGVSAADGKATVTFSTPGWQRLKARRDSGSELTAEAIASNSIDVCVKPSAGAPPCAGLPLSKYPWVVPPSNLPLPVERRAEPTPAPTPTAPAVATPAPTPAPAPVQLSAPVLTTDAVAKGRVDVSWKVTSPGVGVASWVVESRPTNDASAAWTRRAAGSATPGAQLTLPAGTRWTIRLTVVDTAGRRAVAEAGSVLVPIDDRASAVKAGRGWKKVSDKAAWKGSYRRGGAGATLTAKLRAGRPVVVVRGVTRSASIELRAGSRREVYRISGSRTKASREVQLSKAAKAGTVRVTVLRGTVGIDGVAVD